MTRPDRDIRGGAHAAWRLRLERQSLEGFLQKQVAYQCAIWFSDERLLRRRAKVDFRNDLGADDYLAALAGSVAIPAPGLATRRSGESPVPSRGRALVAAGITTVEIEVVRECMGGQALKVLGTELARSSIRASTPDAPRRTSGVGGTV
jgi:hypothetical protein